MKAIPPHVGLSVDATVHGDAATGPLLQTIFAHHDSDLARGYTDWADRCLSASDYFPDQDLSTLMATFFVEHNDVTIHLRDIAALGLDKTPLHVYAEGAQDPTKIDLSLLFVGFLDRHLRRRRAVKKL